MSFVYMYKSINHKSYEKKRKKKKKKGAFYKFFVNKKRF